MVWKLKYQCLPVWLWVSVNPAGALPADCTEAPWEGAQLPLRPSNSQCKPLQLGTSPCLGERQGLVCLCYFVFRYIPETAVHYPDVFIFKEFSQHLIFFFVFLISSNLSPCWNTMLFLITFSLLYFGCGRVPGPLRHKQESFSKTGMGLQRS